MGTTTKAIAYLRVSSDEQANEGVSLDAQRTKITQWCESQGVELVDVIADEAVSGSVALGSRPNGRRIAELLDARKPSADMVIVTRLDRLGRDAAEALSLYKRFRTGKVGLVSIAERIDLGTPHGRAMAQVSAVFAELERSLVAARTVDALAELRRQGKAWNHAPYGYDVIDGSLVINPTEQTVLARMKTDRANGMSFDKLAKALNAEAIPAKRGGPWHAMSVRQVLATATNQ
jgi:site-specific DNA recombinase